MKVTAFVGSARRANTFNAVKEFLEKLHSYGNLESEIILLSEYNIEICRGCKLCLDKEEKGTIILDGGFDSFIKEFYYLIKYLKNHGYQVIAFEGPGQGNVLIKQGIALDYKWEKAVKEILDCLHLTNVSIFGISMGGWFALRAADFEPRIKNVIATGHAVDYMKIPPAAAAWLMLF
ncbi:alpha/beta fold hydrolase [Halanaerobium sp.]|uniref:alpha/beta fold hydrolase n=1 Tax=Halanaerobium sp. TaxID=1895664 RepID=UPI000DE66606|nr:alpha/beta fold hydrolase [Halanaerobium sp.]PUU93657.1 MAG: alpha/beta hydrolase fold protein [Halanaerobium sp.]